MTGLSIDKWGPSAWNFAHCVAHTAPLEIPDEKRDKYKDFILLFGELLPCPTCCAHFSEFTKRNMNAETLKTRRTLVEFLNKAHNEVNARNGKKIYSYQEHCEIYKLRRKSRAPIAATLSTGLVVFSAYMILRKLKTQGKILKST